MQDQGEPARVLPWVGFSEARKILSNYKVVTSYLPLVQVPAEIVGAAISRLEKADLSGTNLSTVQCEASFGVMIILSSQSHYLRNFQVCLLYTSDAADE